MKEDTRLEGPWEFGEWKGRGQGKRKDIDLVKEMIDDGATDKEIADTYWSTYSRIYKAIERYRTLAEPEEERSDIAPWDFHYGQPGTGKTKYIQAKYPGAYWKAPDAWWDGYTGQATVILDEFYGYLPYSQMLRIADGTPLRLGYKGGTVECSINRLIIASNKRPEDWYKGEKVQSIVNVEAITRRIKRVFYHLEGKEPIVMGSYEEFKQFCERENIF